MAKRRPLVIRKNNFVLTKGGESNDSKETSSGGINIVPIGTASNVNGITRVVI